MTDILLRVRLPRDRTKMGDLVLLASNPNAAIETYFRWLTKAGPFLCLGKADNAAAAGAGNPKRDPLHLYGDFPLGEYSCRLIALPGPPGPQFRHEYGPYGFIELTPVSGDALEAQKNGRYGLRAHSGDRNAAGALRPTHGCLRLADEDFLALETAVEMLGPLDTFRLDASELPDVPLVS